eukprot:299131-Chlamydomonas_euryale.AAC.1
MEGGWSLGNWSTRHELKAILLGGMRKGQKDGLLLCVRLPAFLQHPITSTRPADVREETASGDSTHRRLSFPSFHPHPPPPPSQGPIPLGVDTRI